MDEFEIPRDGLAYSCRLQRREKSGRLVVLLRANIDRTTEALPVFLGWPPCFREYSSVLQICDPTLAITRTLTYGCFLGREDADPIEGVAAIARETAERLEVAPEKVLFFGVSGGGFAALRAATLLGGSAAIALNPQIQLQKFAAARFVREIADTFRPGSDPMWVATTYPLRTSVIASVLHARGLGLAPRLTVVQNRADVRHYEDQYGSFCRSFAIPATGGTDSTGRLRCVVFDDPAGHNALPEPGLIHGLAQDALDLAKTATAM